MTRLFQLVAADDGLYVELDIGDGSKRLILSDLGGDLVWNHTVHEVWRRLRESPPHQLKHTQYEYKVVDWEKQSVGEGLTTIMNMLSELGKEGWQLCHHPLSHDTWYLRRERHE